MRPTITECSATLSEKILEKKIGAQIARAPKVSVVIPAYNIADFVADTLASVFAQTYQDYEVILVNDGSEDSPQLEEKLAPFFDRIVYVRQTNRGAAAARNAAICLARGRIIAFLDGDDFWLPEFLASQTEFIEAHDFDMVYCNALLFGAKIYDGTIYMDIAPSNGEVTSAKLITGECGVITSGTLVKKDCFAKHRLFDETMLITQDFEMWFRLAHAGARIGYQKKVLLKYRVRLDSLSGSSVKQAERNIIALNAVRDKHELTDVEQKAWDKQIVVFRAELDLERGKASLASGDYTRAVAHLTAANKYFRKAKLTVIILLLKINPRLAATLFKKIRPAEFSFVTSVDA